MLRFTEIKRPLSPPEDNLKAEPLKRLTLPRTIKHLVMQALAGVFPPSARPKADSQFKSQQPIRWLAAALAF